MNQTSQNKILTVPNGLSLFRLCLIPVIAWLYTVKKEYLWTGAVLILSGVTDALDGFIARRFELVSDLGKVLDPLADKLTQAVMLFCLTTRFPLMLIPFVLLLLKELLMVITGSMVIQKTKRVYSAQWHGKVATALLYGMMVLHVFWYDIPPAVSTTFIVICTAFMLLSLVLYNMYNLRALKESSYLPGEEDPLRH